MIYEDQKGPTLEDIQDKNRAAQVSWDEDVANDALKASLHADGTLMRPGQQPGSLYPDQLERQGYSVERSHNHPANPNQVYNRKLEAQKANRQPTDQELFLGVVAASDTVAGQGTFGSLMTPDEIAQVRERRAEAIPGNQK